MSLLNFSLVLQVILVQVRILSRVKLRLINLAAQRLHHARSFLIHRVRRPGA